MSITLKIKKLVKQSPGVDYCLWARALYRRNRSVYHSSAFGFYFSNLSNIKRIPSLKSKGMQFKKLVDTVKINPAPSDSFFYSIDEFVAPKTIERILDNITIDYSIVINSFIDSSKYDNSIFGTNEKHIIEGLKYYIKKIQKDEKLAKCFEIQIREINTLFERPADSLHSALQRILFVNQWMWQTGHFDNGLGHLDWLLEDLYYKEIKNGAKKENIYKMLKDFFSILHEFYWAKSAKLPGDIGQIIILGGIDQSGEYHYNDLTYMFLNCAKELKIPDPKVLLRVSRKTPDKVIDVALDCLLTGIGGPVFSNDDVVIPKLIEFGFSEGQATRYITSACWEPMVINGAIEQNNIGCLNFAMPIKKMMAVEYANITSSDELIEIYKSLLEEYLHDMLFYLDNKNFECDPYVSLFYENCLESGIDISEGGGNQFNLGITGVGMSTAVNSLLNMKEALDGGTHNLSEIINACRDNYDNFGDLRQELENAKNRYGQDKDEVIEMTNNILRFTTSIVEKHKTKYGGKYKFGLSSPRYIMESKNFPATPDGRKNGEPFDVHISGKNGISPVELMLFASKLDYGVDRINANVVDFILQPSLFQYQDKIRNLIRGGLNEGVFQIQINVVSSETLLNAQQHPEQYRSLIVRVWGFSAYFVELPKEYQDNLIRRTQNSEMLYA